jgi:hypothetical protein
MIYPEFQAFKKIPRLSRDITITEKIDGTNGVIYIDDNGGIAAGSHKQWLWNDEQPEIYSDNHGFAHWVKMHQEELKKLGKGTHYGEFWGKGIQRGYGIENKRFSLFNTSRWCLFNKEPKLISIDPKTKIEKYQERAPQCCHIVPVLYEGIFSMDAIDYCLEFLQDFGSRAVMGFNKPEGLVVWHHAAGQYFKKTIEGDFHGKTF